MSSDWGVGGGEEGSGHCFGEAAVGVSIHVGIYTLSSEWMGGL